MKFCANEVVTRLEHHHYSFFIFISNVIFQDSSWGASFSEIMHVFDFVASFL